MSKFIITETIPWNEIPYPKEILKILEENENLKKRIKLKQKKIFILRKMFKKSEEAVKLMEETKKLQDKAVSFTDKCLERINLMEEVDKKQLILLKNQQEELKVAKGLIKKFIHLVPGMGGFTQMA